MIKYGLIVLGMAIVTYIPRMVPMVFIQKNKLPPFVSRFLKFIPYAALGALIFPGILTSTGNIQSAIVGGIAAIILANLGANLILVVFASIGGVFLWQLFL